MAAGGLYLLLQRAMKALGERGRRRPVLRCLLAGLVLALVAHVLPLAQFSGESQMGELMGTWTSYPLAVLLGSGIAKLAMTSLCFHLGWRGGSIFPVIFSGVAIGYAFAGAVGMDGSYAVAIVTAALCSLVMGKPLTAVAVLLLCFPVTYLPAMGIAAFAASLVVNGIKKRRLGPAEG